MAEYNGPRSIAEETEAIEDEITRAYVYDGRAALEQEARKHGWTVQLWDRVGDDDVVAYRKDGQLILVTWTVLRTAYNVGHSPDWPNVRVYPILSGALALVDARAIIEMSVVAAL